jgi:hypothetical protein
MTQFRPVQADRRSWQAAGCLRLASASRIPGTVAARNLSLGKGKARGPTRTEPSRLASRRHDGSADELGSRSLT